MMASASGAAAAPYYGVLDLGSTYNSTDFSTSSYQVDADADGNLYFQLQTKETTNNYIDVMLVKVDPSGSIDTITYETQSRTDAPFPRATMVSSTGDIYTILYAMNSGLTQQPYLRKYNSSLALQWTAQINGTAMAGSEQMTEDNDGNIVVTTQLTGVSSAYQNFGVAKFDTSGNRVTMSGQQIKHFRSSTSDQVLGIGMNVDSSNNYYFAMREAGNNEAFWVKTNDDVVIQSQGGIGTRSFTVRDAPLIDSNGNMYFINHNTQTGTPNGHVVRKYNSSLVLQSEVYLRNTTASDNINGHTQMAAIDSNDNLYIVCETKNTGGSQDSQFIVKLNSSLSKQWERRFYTGITTPEDILNVKLVVDGNDDLIILAREGGTTKFQYILKYPSDGSITGSYTPSGLTADTYQLTIANTSQITVSTGSSTNASGSLSVSSGSASSGSNIATVSTPSRSINGIDTVLL